MRWGSLQFTILFRHIDEEEAGRREKGAGSREQGLRRECSAERNIELGIQTLAPLCSTAEEKESLPPAQKPPSPLLLVG